MRDRMAWAPAVVLFVGVVLSFWVREPRSVDLRQPLDQLPRSLGGSASREIALSPEELAANGASSYLYRAYESGAGNEAFSLYVGYYASQRQGKTIHSPKNCLPGSGWEPLEAKIVTLPAGGTEVPVNRYILANGGSRAVVYYWYQGRGRVAADEYQVKWQLLRDAALTRRSEEALFRIVVPLSDTVTESQADQIAADAIATLVPAAWALLPAYGEQATKSL